MICGFGNQFELMRQHPTVTFVIFPRKSRGSQPVKLQVVESVPSHPYTVFPASLCLITLALLHTHSTPPTLIMHLSSTTPFIHTLVCSPNLHLSCTPLHLPCTSYLICTVLLLTLVHSPFLPISELCAPPVTFSALPCILPDLCHTSCTPFCFLPHLAASFTYLLAYNFLLASPLSLVVRSQKDVASPNSHGIQLTNNNLIYPLQLHCLAMKILLPLVVNCEVSIYNLMSLSASSCML